MQKSFVSFYFSLNKEKYFLHGEDYKVGFVGAGDVKLFTNFLVSCVMLVLF